MRTIHYSKYQLGKEDWEAQSAARRHHPAVTLAFRDKAGKHCVTLKAGTSDDVSVFRTGEETLVLSINRRLGYVGLEIFKGSEEIGEIFKDLREDWEDLSELTLAKLLAEYIY